MSHEQLPLVPPSSGPMGHPMHAHPHPPINSGVVSAYHAAIYPPELAPGSPALLEAVNKLKFFLATAPSTYDQSPYDHNDPNIRDERLLNRFQLPTGEMITCVFWNGLYHITGTDIVRALNFRFLAFGRPVKNVKKFEEGIFSDLRNLKSGTDATLEDPKSPFLELLFKYNCIRTQKKQKVFYWFSVPHDRLFLDALDRDLKREKLGVESTTEAVAEPALSFVYNPTKTLYEQFAQSASGVDGSMDSLAEVVDRKATAQAVNGSGDGSEGDSPGQGEGGSRPSVSRQNSRQGSAIFGAFSLFEGSPSYKQRRKPSSKRQPNQKQLPKPIKTEPGYGSLSVSPNPPDGDERMRSVSASGSAMGMSMSPAPSRSVSSSHLPVPGQGHMSISPQPAPPMMYTFAAYTAIAPQGHVQASTSAHHLGSPVAGPEKRYHCRMPHCGRVFDRPELLKRHTSAHAVRKSSFQSNHSMTDNEGIPSPIEDGEDDLGAQYDDSPQEMPYEHRGSEQLNGIGITVTSEDHPQYAAQLVTPPMSVDAGYEHAFEGQIAQGLSHDHAQPTYAWQQSATGFMPQASLMTPVESEVDRFEHHHSQGQASPHQLNGIQHPSHSAGPLSHPVFERHNSISHEFGGRAAMPRTALGAAAQAQLVMNAERRHRSATPTYGRAPVFARKGSLGFVPSGLGYRPAMDGQIHFTPELRGQGPNQPAFASQLQAIHALSAEVDGPSSSLLAQPHSAPGDMTGFPSFPSDGHHVEGLGFHNVDVGNDDNFLHPRSFTQSRHFDSPTQQRPASATEGMLGHDFGHFASPVPSADGVSL